MPPAVKLYFDSGVGFLFIRQPCEIVHTGIQSKGNAAALLKGEVPFSAFQFGIIALVNAGQKLHLYLCQLLFESKLLHSRHLHHLFQNSGAAALRTVRLENHAEIGENRACALQYPSSGVILT